MIERRQSARHRLDVFFNKFLDGQPYLCRALDVSSSGLLAERFTEPETHARSFPLELRLPGAHRSVWIWARRVGARGERQVFRFLSMHADDRRRLDRYLAVAS